MICNGSSDDLQRQQRPNLHVWPQCQGATSCAVSWALFSCGRAGNCWTGCGGGRGGSSGLCELRASAARRTASSPGISRSSTGSTTRPGPKPLPLGCHDIVPRVTPFIHKNVREHGKTCFSWFGPMPIVTLTDPALVKDVLSNKFGHFEKPQFPVLAKLLADGLAAGHIGEKWVKHRRILNPAFHLEKIKLVSRWTQSLGSDGSCEMDVWPEIQALTGDVISHAAFGSSYHEGRRVFQLQAEQAELFIAALQKIVIPGYMYLPTKNNRRMRRISKEVNSILRGLIGKRVEAVEKGESTNDDLLGLLLESNMRRTDENGNSSLGMTIEEVIEECKLFYFAGMETTSVLLTWTMVLLCMHPEWQERAREEVISLFGKNKPEYEGLSRLKTVRMILYEVLRLYPPAIVFSRKTYKEMTIGDVTYPAGVILELPVLFIHHDPDTWGSDVNDFKPERFAEGIFKASKDPGAFLPFGWGPHLDFYAQPYLEVPPLPPPRTTPALAAKVPAAPSSLPPPMELVVAPPPVAT
ncbi:hypothetical protein PR202_gb05466 [Eleusine coracana subsp. coracana]|uniref:Uncharacterized protein n=1 Tax=Eleusine coracana subsp. coracana TaxID=191504 RepID=A0AAV5E6E4_ELECO|nr:hypothetical protein PR202_gb05466 [Eleusine coracana subsp. coracana]